MKKWIMYFCWAAFAIFVLINVTRLIEPDAFTSSQRTTKEESLLELHNKERTKKGYKELVLDDVLCGYAQKHAEYMAKNNNLVHSSMDKLQKHCGASVVGENIAWGQETPESVVSAWMWSPMHRWNILGSSYKKVGFGVKEDDKGRAYWCTVLSN